MPQDPDKKLVRVRGGPRGFRIISLGSWKQENKERRGKLPEASSPRSRKAERVRKRKNKRKQK